MKITKYQLRKIIKESLGLKEGLVKKAISKIPYKTINKVYDRHQGVGTFLANIKVNEKIKNAKPEDWWESSTIGSSQLDSTKDGDSEDTSGVAGLSKRKDGYGYMRKQVKKSFLTTTGRVTSFLLMIKITHG